MTTTSIPVRSDLLNYNFDITLDNILYNFSFYFNVREQSWELTISNSGVQQLQGLRVICGTDILAQYSYNYSLPQGNLNVIDLDGLDRDPDSAIFGNRIIMEYIN